MMAATVWGRQQGDMCKSGIYRHIKDSEYDVSDHGVEGISGDACCVIQLRSGLSRALHKKASLSVIFMDNMGLYGLKKSSK
jgi:hypothetical protein